MSSRALTAFEAYVQALNRGDVDAAVSAFGADARIRHRQGTFSDPEAIRRLIEEIASSESEFTVNRIMSDGNAAMAELRFEGPDGRGHLAAILIVDDEGGIRDLALYYR